MAFRLVLLVMSQNLENQDAMKQFKLPEKPSLLCACPGQVWEFIEDAPLATLHVIKGKRSLLGPTMKITKQEYIQEMQEICGIFTIGYVWSQKHVC